MFSQEFIRLLIIHELVFWNLMQRNIYSHAVSILTSIFQLLLIMMSFRSGHYDFSFPATFIKTRISLDTTEILDLMY